MKRSRALPAITTLSGGVSGPAIGDRGAGHFDSPTAFSNTSILIDMKKEDFLKAARAAAPHVTAQIEWLEGQDYGEHDQAWLQALDVLGKERSALWATLERLEKRYEKLEADEWIRFAAFSAMDNAIQTSRDERWDMSDIENQIAVYRMATDEDTIREWFENYPND